MWIHALLEERCSVPIEYHIRYGILLGQRPCSGSDVKSENPGSDTSSGSGAQRRSGRSEHYRSDTMLIVLASTNWGHLDLGWLLRK